MKKLLITGFPGFVSGHLQSYVSKHHSQRFKVFGTYRNSKNLKEYEGLTLIEIDLNNRDHILSVLEKIEPRYIIHLAAKSSVAYSWNNPVESFRNNTNIFLNLVDAIYKSGLNCRLLSIGSSEQYGDVNPENLPLSEDDIQNPVSPYAIARVSQEMLARLYSESYGLDIVMTRSFNHIGPGQSGKFVISSFAKQLAAIISEKSEHRITVGDLSIVRDFVDVRDVVRAYVLLLEEGRNNEVYNICSGKGNSLETILNSMIEITGTDVTIETAPDLIRPNDNPAIIGSNEKILNQCGWQPRISLQKSLEDIIESWEKKLQM